MKRDIEGLAMGTLERKTNGNSQETGEQKIKKLGVHTLLNQGGKNGQNHHKLRVLFCLWMFTLSTFGPSLAVEGHYRIVFCI